MNRFLMMTILLLSFSTITRAQIQRGNIMAGGDIAGFQLNTNKNGEFNMNLNPKIAFFIRDNIAVGPYLKAGLSTARGAGTSVNYGVGAFGRYYMNDTTLDLVRHGRFFFEGNAGIEGANPAIGSSTNGLGLGIGPGFAYFITPNVGLEALLKYNGIIGFGSSLTSGFVELGLGLQIYLPSGRVKNKFMGM